MKQQFISARRFLMMLVALVLIPVGSARAASTTEVAMRSFAFNPAVVNVNVGDTVRWTNDDGVAHNVSGLGVGTPSGNFLGTYSATFTQAGSFPYICSLHSGMAGTVNVAQAPEPVVPEVPFAIVLPITALFVISVLWFGRRRRVHG